MSLKCFRACALLYLLFMMSAAGAQGLPKGVIMQNGDSAFALNLENMDGEPYDLKQSRGRWVFLHFWASWCGPCRREMPTIQAIAEQLDKSQWDIVLINTAEDEDTVFSFISAVAPDLNPLMDKDGQVTQQWQPRGLPSTFLIDPKGKVRYLALGGRPWNDASYLSFLKKLAKTIK